MISLRTDGGTINLVKKSSSAMEPGIFLPSRQHFYSITIQLFMSEISRLHLSLIIFSSIFARAFSDPQVKSLRFRVLGFSLVTLVPLSLAILSSYAISWASYD